MDVEHAARPFAHEAFGEDTHESGEDYNLSVGSNQRLMELLVVIGTVLVALVRYNLERIKNRTTG